MRVKSVKASERFREDPHSLYGQFSPDIVNKWTKIPIRATEGGEYRPPRTIGRQLRLECSPLVSSGEEECKAKAARSSVS